MHHTKLIYDIPLSGVPEGKKCVVNQISAGRGLARRLAELGFLEGASVRVDRSEGGAMIVSINGQRFALSRGIANKIGIKQF
jgi:ferrous iron transport protein A